MKQLLLIIVSLLLLNSCSKFQRHMKSTDMEAKYEAAVKYYEKKDYYHALQLFEELITVFRGTSKAEKSYYYYTYCTFYVDDYIMAAYHFNNFVQSYPVSPFAEEMQYMYAYCYYLDSPISSLDQTSTVEAIDKFQLFINKYPTSSKVEESNKRIDELRQKLEEKAFANAKMFYHTENYKAAVISFANLLKDYPYTIYKEESLFLSLKSSYLFAMNSIDSKRVERMKLASEDYYKLVDNFPQSKYLREAENILDNIQKETSKKQSSTSKIN